MNIKFKRIPNEPEWEVWVDGPNLLGKVVHLGPMGWVFQTQLNFSHNLTVGIMDRITNVLKKLNQAVSTTSPF